MQELDVEVETEKVSKKQCKVNIACKIYKIFGHKKQAVNAQKQVIYMKRTYEQVATS